MNISTIVLIPGAGGDAFYWYRVAPILREAGYDVVTPELPSGDESAGIDEYADAVIAAVGRGAASSWWASRSGPLRPPPCASAFLSRCSCSWRA